jgi:hypothetical protein
MKTLQKGLAVAVIQILIVLSVGGKLLYDRATKPRVWVRTASIDPDLPIRGRYLTLNLEVHTAEPLLVQDPKHPGLYSGGPYVDLAVENNQLIAHKTERPTGMTINSLAWRRNARADTYVLSSPVLFFLPEHAEVPRLGSNGELWAEVTVPKKVHRAPFNSPSNGETNGRSSLTVD